MIDIGLEKTIRDQRRKIDWWIDGSIDELIEKYTDRLTRTILLVEMVVREVEVDVEVLILAKNIHGFLKYQKYCYFELKKRFKYVIEIYTWF